LKTATETAFALAVGDVSAPVQTPFGWHLFKLDKITPPRRLGFDEIRQDLHDEMALDLAGESLFRLSTELEDELGGGASLEQGAAVVGADITRIEGVSARGLDENEEPVLGELAEREEIISILFATAEGSESLLNELDDGSFVILRVDRVIPPAARPLDEVRPQVRTALWRDAEAEAASKVAETLAARIKGGEALAAAAADAGLTVIKIENATRDGRNAGPEASVELIEQLFSQEPGDTEPIVAATRSGWAVAVLTDVDDAGSADSQLEQLRDQLAGAWSGDIAEAYRRALYGRHAVEINDTLLGQLFDQP
jgi:peptidyl-prolyl cis-trans isomerase D